MEMVLIFDVVYSAMYNLQNILIFEKSVPKVLTFVPTMIIIKELGVISNEEEECHQPNKVLL